MEYMNTIKQKTTDEQGFIMMTALMILVILVIIGVSATSTSIFELQIARNEMDAKNNFYSADSGVMVAAKLIRESADNNGNPDLTDFADTAVVKHLVLGPDRTINTNNYLTYNNNFFQKILIYDPANPGDFIINTGIPGIANLPVDADLPLNGLDDDEVNADPDITFQLGDPTVMVPRDIAMKIIRVGSVPLAGSSAEFASGAEGLGSGAANVAVIYDINSEATANAAGGSKADITARYRYVPGTAGGL